MNYNCVLRLQIIVIPRYSTETGPSNDTVDRGAHVLGTTGVDVNIMIILCRLQIYIHLYYTCNFGITNVNMCNYKMCLIIFFHRL